MICALNAVGGTLRTHISGEEILPRNLGIARIAEQEWKEILKIRLIDADVIEYPTVNKPPFDCDAFDNAYCEGVYDTFEVIKKMPTVDAEPVRHGHWKLRHAGNAVCSVCGFWGMSVWDYDRSDNYCSHCGAKMDEEDENG